MAVVLDLYRDRMSYGGYFEQLYLPSRMAKKEAFGCFPILK